MEELFLKTEHGIMAIESALVQKYNIIRGAKSPFNGYPIVGKDGEEMHLESKKETLQIDDNPQVLTASEVIDFIQGSDSYA